MTTRAIDDLALEAKVGQLFAVGFDGPTPTDDVLALVREYNLGGVVYFSRNVRTPRQVADLTGALQDAATAQGAGHPLFVATDQEGGVVSRLDWGTTLPGHMALGACGDDETAYRAGRATATELRALGVNLDLAPVLDVNNNPDNPVIGVRSFGESPAAVGDLGAAFARGLQSAGVLGCGKHFPGHGDTAADSHETLPVVAHDRDRLDAVEFAPFRAAIAAGIDAIMTTHVAFPTITGDPDRPATIAPSVQRDLLRDDLGFDGLVVTDCLEMDAIADGVGTAEGAVQAVEAGCDVVMVSHTPARQRAAIEAVVDAVRSGRIPESRIDESVARIHAAKRNRIADAGAPDVDRWKAAAADARTVARDVADCAVTVVRDRDGVVPFDADRPLHVVGFTGDRGSPAEDDRYDPGAVADALADAGADVRAHEDPGPDAIADALPAAAQVVVATYDARTNARQAAVVDALAAHAGPVAVVAVRNPYDLAACPDAGTFVTCYDYTRASLRATAAVLLGDHDPRGSLPVTMPETDAA